MSLTVNTHLLPKNNWNNNQANLSSAPHTEVAPVPADTAADTVNVRNLDTYTSTITSSLTSLQSSVENMASMLNRIRDKGFTQPSAALLRMQFAEQPHIAMLAQANISPQTVSALLR